MKRLISVFCIALTLLLMVYGATAALAESADEPIIIYGAFETLEKGSKGDDVKQLQQALIEQGFLKGKADGDYGKGTASAVSSFQESVGLEATGIADEATQQQLYGGVDVRAALLGETWFFNGGSDIALNALQFGEDAVKLTQVTFDDNGISVNAENEFPYVLNSDGIVITLFDGSEMNIAFAAEGSQLVLNDHEYWSLAEVDAALQGYWVSAYTEFDLKYEDHVCFEDGKIRSERANEGFGMGKGEYYYAGPYDGTYTLGLGNIETDMFKGKAYGFNIIDGKPALMRYTRVYEATTKGFPGQKGYKF